MWAGQAFINYDWQLMRVFLLAVSDPQGWGDERASTAAADAGEQLQGHYR